MKYDTNLNNASLWVNSSKFTPTFAACLIHPQQKVGNLYNTACVTALGSWANQKCSIIPIMSQFPLAQTWTPKHEENNRKVVLKSMNNWQGKIMTSVLEATSGLTLRASPVSKKVPNPWSSNFDLAIRGKCQPYCHWTRRGAANRLLKFVCQLSKQTTLSNSDLLALMLPSWSAFARFSTAITSPGNLDPGHSIFRSCQKAKYCALVWPTPFMFWAPGCCHPLICWGELWATKGAH